MESGNSRWDIIDMVRLTHALRPEGIEWPKKDTGSTSFRLEKLTQANGIDHAGAHEALSDVHATISLARLIRTQQPKLFDYLFELRDKRKTANQLNLQTQTMVLHVSSMYPAELGCIAPVIPLANHPTNKNAIIVFDLRHDPETLLQLSVEEIQQRLFVRKEDLPEGEERVPLKTVHINKCPVIVPTATMNPPEAERWQIDIQLAEKHAGMLRGNPTLAKKIQDVHEAREFPTTSDPDQNLYGGGFFSNLDRTKMTDLTDMNPTELSKTRMQFDDPRIPEMLFRYRARNWPQSLSQEERKRWEEFRHHRLCNDKADSGITLKEYQKQLAEKIMQPGIDARERGILSDLADWPSIIQLQAD